MVNLNFLAIVASAFVALSASFAWYLLFARPWRQFSGQPQNTRQRNWRLELWRILGELIRNTVLALVIQYVVIRTFTESWVGALLMGLLLWVGFPVVLLSGSVMRESYPWKLAAIHGGDWLVKLLLITLIVNAWR